MLIIDYIRVEDFGPLRGKHFFRFDPMMNVIIGYNGTGKTHILDLIATVTGNDQAMRMFDRFSFGRVELGVSVDGKKIKFEAANQFDYADLLDFRKEISPFQANYALTETQTEKLLAGCCDFATAKKRIEKFLKDQEVTVYNTKEPYKSSIFLGDGWVHFIRLILWANMSGGPLLLDLPERHLDIVAKRRAYGVIELSKEQVILTTHTPEFLPYADSDKNIIDLSSRG